MGNVRAQDDSSRLIPEISTLFSALIERAHQGQTLSWRPNTGKAKCFIEVRGGQKRDLLFEFMRITNPDGSSTKTFYRQDDPDLAGAVDKQESYDSANNLIASSSSTYTKFHPFGSGTTMIRPLFQSATSR